jgi:hypothetical protein
LKTTPTHDGKVDFDTVLELGALLPGVKASSSKLVSLGDNKVPKMVKFSRREKVSKALAFRQQRGMRIS